MSTTLGSRRREGVLLQSSRVSAVTLPHPMTGATGVVRLVRHGCPRGLDTGKGSSLPPVDRPPGVVTSL